MRVFAVSPSLRLLIVAGAAAIIAACSSGNSNVPTYTPSSGTSGVETSTTSAVGLPALSNSGVTFNGTLASTSAAVLLSEQLSGTPPSGVTALAAARSTESKPLDATPTPNPIAYVTLNVPTTVTVAAGSSVSFTLAQLTAGVSYYLGVYSNGTWTAPAAGPATVSGTTLTFANLPSFTLTAGSPTVIALYSTTASATASPTPTASPTASPSPSPTPVVSPASITFDITASPTPAAVSVTETGYTGSFTSAINCTASPAPSPVPTTNPFVAQISPASASQSALAPAAFSVTPGNETGTCTASFTDANNATVSIPVLNGSTSLNVYNSQRH